MRLLTGRTCAHAEEKRARGSARPRIFHAQTPGAVIKLITHTSANTNKVETDTFLLVHVLVHCLSFNQKKKKEKALLFFLSSSRSGKSAGVLFYPPVSSPLSCPESPRVSRLRVFLELRTEDARWRRRRRRKSR